MSERPEIVTDEHLKYLDGLRESGKVNMVGARPYIENEFDLEKEEAAIIHVYWMKSFGERHPR